MSATPQVAVLGAGRFNTNAASARRRRAPDGVLTLVAFALLGAYGLIRWATMLSHPHVGRLTGLLALALAVTALGWSAHDAPRLLRLALTAGCVLGGLAMIPMSGFPFAWFWDVRIAVQFRAIGHGLSTLPGVIVPYKGHDRATASVITLGAGMLLLGGALTLAAARRRPRPGGAAREARLVGAALPLVVLAIVPSALARPTVAYLHGAMLFVLLTLFVFAERIPRGRSLGSASVIAVAVLGALVLAPVIDGRSAWIRFTSIAGTVGSGRGGERFDWSQTYGPLAWPHTGNTVLFVRAAHPYYWKAENLSFFDGQGWTAAPVGDASDPLEGVSRVAARRYTQVVSVTDRAISTSDLITAGEATAPSVVAGVPVGGGDVPGTFTTGTPLQPGDTYRLRAYTPSPTGAELNRTGHDYPSAVVYADLTLMLSPGGGRSGLPATIRPENYVFAPYGSRAVNANAPGVTGSESEHAIATSAWGPVLGLAQRLKAGTTTPYGYVQAVLRYLGNGYGYNQNTPLTANPLLTFLFDTKVGYCQQFAGAMALLLRMGGVPARLAAGFATGTYDGIRRAYVVSDIDAHAWVEAWFPTYGWVKFDPTPTSDPALQPHIAISPGQNDLGHPQKSLAAAHNRRDAGAAATARRRHRTGGSGAPWAALGGSLALLLIVGLTVDGYRRRRPPPSAASLAAELERAFARCRRPLAPGATLAEIERTFADAPAAAAYVRTIRNARYAGITASPTHEQRRAVRSRLRRGLGPTGWLRAFVSVPPRPSRSRPGQAYTGGDG